MKNVSFWILIHLALTYLAVVSSILFELHPARFARQRYARSRKVSNFTGRSANPILSNGQILDFMAISNLYGYLAEEHPVTTADGYKLMLHRIPGREDCRRQGKKPIVYFQHGMLGSSDSWILRGPGKDLAYMLVDAGYDVWFGNARGNTYSRAHTKLSPDNNPRFWRFSYHEMALYDVPAMIDHILSTTGQKRLVYLGHSMGSTISYALLSCRPEYNAKVSLVISLAPVAFWHARPTPFARLLIDRTPAIKKFVTKSGFHEIFPLTSFNGAIARSICNEKSILQPACISLVYFIFGFNPKQFNSTLMQYVLSYVPAGSSVELLMHYSQNLATGDFNMYDFDLVKNLAIYKKRSPPAYNLKNIVAPVALMYGEGDGLVSPANVIELSRKLPNLVTSEPVPDERFSHLDFLFSNDLKTLVNDRLIEIISAYSRSSRDAC